MTLTVVGVDPGGSDVGIVVRQGHRLVRAVRLVRDPGVTRAAWVEEVAVAVVGVQVEAGSPPVAAEDVNEPSPHLGVISVGGILDTAAVLGGLIVAVAELLVIPPAGNGSGPIDAYPAELRPSRGKGAGRDNRRHLRSAWDVAGAGLFQARSNQPPTLGVPR